MKLRLATAAVAALILPLAACGNADDEKAAEGVSKSLQSGEEGDLKLSKDDADCVGEKMVDELGRDKLVEYKILDKDYNATDKDTDPGDMSKGDAEKSADAFEECTDLKKLLMDEMDSDVPEEVSSCLNDKISESDVRDFMAANFAGDDEGGQKILTDAAGECVQS